MMKFNFPHYSVPPDGLRFIVPEDGRPIEATDRKAWYDKIKKHYADNGYTLPENWKEIAEDQRCRTLPPGWCLHEDGRLEYDSISLRMEIGDFWRGMDVLKNIVLDPEPFVEKPIAEARAAICASCPANTAVPGCHSCHKVANHILAIKGTQETSSDPLLKACGVCKCSNQAQVWVKARLLEKGITPDQMRKFRLMDHCWKWKSCESHDDTAGLPSTEVAT